MSSALRSDGRRVENPDERIASRCGPAGASAACFPRAAITHRLMEEGDVHVVRHRCSGHVMQVAYSALNRLGITLDRIEVTGTEPHQFGVLIVVDGVGIRSRFMSPLVVEEIGKLAADVPAGPHRKLYIKHAG